jgi:hypothetical protein
MFSFGRSTGILEGVLAGLQIPMTIVTPQALRAECERLMQDKEAVAREMAEFREWEELSTPWPD